jgi:hypothetical protein
LITRVVVITCHLLLLGDHTLFFILYFLKLLWMRYIF